MSACRKWQYEKIIRRKGNINGTHLPVKMQVNDGCGQARFFYGYVTCMSEVQTLPSVFLHIFRAQEICATVIIIGGVSSYDSLCNPVK